MIVSCKTSGSTDLLFNDINDFAQVFCNEVSLRYVGRSVHDPVVLCELDVHAMLTNQRVYIADETRKQTSYNAQSLLPSP